ncbi:MAG: NAD(P)H-dependent oxidoreductase [Bacteroidales bacterium]|jgi:flavodoxin|nr:NAD(P)H-dependent oxidoreductase [Bacteroidales bacterium]
MSKQHLVLSALAIIFLFSSCTNAQTPKTNNEMKVLVTYFSATGTTKAVAEKLSKITNADIYEIKPEVPYTSADLDWHDKESRSTIEMQDKNSRPAIADKNAKIENYDVIYVGFPIWWYVAPTIINTFLESYDFSEKTVILFATSGGSGFGKTVEDLKGSCSPKTIIKEGKVFSGHPTETDIEAWVKSMKD